MSVYLNYASAICALGGNLKAIDQSLFSGTGSSLRPTDRFSPGRVKPLGIVAEQLPTIEEPLYNTRNNRLLLAALNSLDAQISKLKQQVDPSRIGVIIGSSTSGIHEGEEAVAFHDLHGEFPASYDYRMQEIGAPSEYVRHHLGSEGPAWTISTACTSGAKALASAARLIEMDVCDVVIAGGADSMCRLTVEGFDSLSALSDEICLPFSVNRKGINIGEAAALFVLSKEERGARFAGVGETSDAHHISAPDPTGAGAILAMQQALTHAGLRPDEIDYINLHGTATEQNDKMESLAVHSVFGETIPCGSTKALTGHTLGAAGALEAAFCWLCLQRNDLALPKQLWDGQYDPSLAPLKGIAADRAKTLPLRVMSNSFAFGGNNMSLILERV